MRIVAIAAVVCLVMSPVAFAGDLVASDVEANSFFTGVWEVISAIPLLLIDIVDSTSKGESAEENPAVDPPETEAGPMIIIDG